MARQSVSVRRLSRRSILVLLLPWFWPFVGTGIVLGEDVASTLLAGLNNHLEQLQSGIVEFEVREANDRVVAKRFVAFDNRTEKVRSDTEVLQDGRIVRVVLTKQDFLQFVSRDGGGVLTRLNPGEESQVSDGMPIDVRAIGLCEYMDLRRNGQAEEVLSNIKGMTLVNAALENDVGMIVYNARVDGGIATHIVWWIDTAKDYVPVRREVRLVASDGRSHVLQRLETSWEQVNNTWVPIKSTSRQFGPSGDSRSLGALHLTWKSVNGKVPDALFSEESLKLPMNTYIVDSRLGPPLLEKVIGLERPVPESPTPRRMSTLASAAVGLALPLLVVVVLILRHRRRRNCN